MIFFEDILRLAGDFVKFYPNQDHKMQRPQTFALLQTLSELSTQNLNKVLGDKGKPYFFSRKWAKAGHSNSALEYEEPLLIGFERGTRVKGLFEKKQIETRILEFMYLERYDEDCAKKSSGDKMSNRVINEIFKSTHIKLKEFFAYLNECQYYTVDDLPNAVYHPNVIGLLITNEHITSATIDVNLTRQWQLGLKQKAEINLVPWDGGMRDLYGTAAEVSFKFMKCENFDYDAKWQSYRKIGDNYC